MFLFKISTIKNVIITGITGQYPTKIIKGSLLVNYMTKVYVDSNVFLAVVLGDFGRAFEFMDYKSKEFLDKVISCKYEIVISDIVLAEIQKKTYFDEKDIMLLMAPFSNKLTKIRATEELFKQAVKLNKKLKTGVSDCMHYLISKNYDCIVTWNTKHFQNGRTPSEM